METTEWRCFHCDEVFTDPKSAQDHFGDGGGCDPEPPACKLNAMEGGLLNGSVVKENLITQFLTDAAEWFEKRAADSSEDIEHQAMASNARNCREAASALSTSRAEIEAVVKERDEMRASVIGEIAAERRRQVQQEGWTTEHDDLHCGGELSSAAACYALEPRFGPATLARVLNEENERMTEEPKPRACPRCDFSSGQRGMDRCHYCDGTGSVFLAGGRYHPNTKEGFEAAQADLLLHVAREALSQSAGEGMAEKKWLGEILTVIHRDGGHYQTTHGTAKAVVDAHKIVSDLFATARTLSGWGEYAGGGA